MNELARLHCSPVNENTPKITEAETRDYLARMPEWRLTLKEGEPRLERAFTFKDFTQAISFTDQVADLANEEDHHPAILTEWGRVTVTWWTHKIRGLHQNDFIMAAKTEILYKNLGNKPE